MGGRGEGQYEGRGKREKERWPEDRGRFEDFKRGTGRVKGEWKNISQHENPCICGMHKIYLVYKPKALIYRCILYSSFINDSNVIILEL